VERGPMALFGAIVAIGLGPAMWLGAQFGQATLSPDRPPAVTTVQQDAVAPRGGSGAGDAPTDAEAIRTEPKANTQPLTRTKRTQPVVTTSPSPSPSESEQASTPPAESSSPTASDPGADETDLPTDPTTSPDDPPPGGDDGPDEPPSGQQSDSVTGANSLI
jgi:hypothetical protein